MVELKRLKITKKKEDSTDNYQTNNYISDSKDLYNYKSKEIILKKLIVENKKDAPEIKEISKTFKNQETEKQKLKKVSIKASKTKKSKPKLVVDSKTEFLKNNLLFQVEKKKLEVLSEDLSKNELEKSYDLVKNTDSNVDELLDNLANQTKNANNEVFLEVFSFLEDKPTKKRIAISNLDVSNLYAKIDDIEKKQIPQIIQTEYIDQNKLPEKQKKETNEEKIDIMPLIEEIEIPEIFALRDDTKIVEAVNEKFISLEKKAKIETAKEPNFISSNTKLKSNPLLDEKINNIKIKTDNLKISIPIDYDFSKTKKKYSKEPKISEIIEYNFSEKPTNISKSEKHQEVKVVDSSFSKKDNLEIYNDLQTTTQSPIDQEEVKIQRGFSRNQEEYDILKNYEKPNHTENKIFIPKRQKTDQSFDYMLPKDYLNSTDKIKAVDLINKEKNKINLIYNSQIKLKNIDIDNVNEKYNLDDFTFVNIKYLKDELFYNIIQPELNATQKKIYLEIKKIFLDSIDTSFYSLKGDKKSIENYIEKIFNLTVEKTAYDINNLEKKLYLNFIKQEINGLGFLASILDDKNVLEINCIGAGIPIVAYHIKYGLLKTNLSFENVSDLNSFVLSLAKIIGIRVNLNNPIFKGNFPNGYKIEGLYSLESTCNKGSSFIIRKYLEEPLTPSNLINLGIGTPDVFTYIWSAINQNYQIVLAGDENALLINAIAQFYPNKNIASIQSFDYFKFPQKNWIKRTLANPSIDKNTILTQTILERPDYIILDEFIDDFFENKWYNINLMVIDTKLATKYIEKAKAIGINAMIIQLDRANFKSVEHTQISKIIEINKGKEQQIIEYIKEENAFNINLISSNIDVVDFFNKLKVLRWLIDVDISDYLDFNNVINDYYIDKDKLFKKLNIENKEE